MTIKIPVIDVNGKKLDDFELSFQETTPEQLNARVHQLVKWQDRQNHQFLASTKTRAEVRGGGAKPYKQKGTGRARRGSQRTPLRVGGGVVFGPKFRDPNFSINKQELKLAYQALIMAVASRIVVVKMPADLVVRTGPFVSGVVKGLRSKDSHISFVLGPEEDGVFRGVRNIANSDINFANEISVNSLLKAEHVITTEAGFQWVKERILG